MVYGVIYRITCLCNGKCYHGQTVNPDERWPHHQRSSSHCIALRNALAKYGPENFTFEIIEGASSKKKLDDLEKQYVATSLAPRGYNIKEGGANGRPSLATRQKMSESGKIAQNRPEVKKRNSEGVRRAFTRPEVRQRHSAAVRAALQRPDTLERMRQRMLALFSQPGERERRGSAIQKSWASYTEVERDQRLAALRAVVGSEEHRTLMSRVSSETLANPDVRERLREGVRSSWTPERREKMRTQMQKIHARLGTKEARGKAISDAQSTPEVREKLRRRRRRGESEEAWQERIRGYDSA